MCLYLEDMIGDNTIDDDFFSNIGGENIDWFVFVVMIDLDVIVETTLMISVPKYYHFWWMWTWFYNTHIFFWRCWRQKELKIKISWLTGLETFCCRICRAIAHIFRYIFKTPIIITFIRPLPSHGWEITRNIDEWWNQTSIYLGFEILGIVMTLIHMTKLSLCGLAHDCQRGSFNPKTHGRGWLFNSRLQTLLSPRRKTCQVVNYRLCFGVGLSVFCLKIIKLNNPITHFCDRLTSTLQLHATQNGSSPNVVMGFTTPSMAIYVNGSYILVVGVVHYYVGQNDIIKIILQAYRIFWGFKTTCYGGWSMSYHICVKFK